MPKMIFIEPKAPNLHIFSKFTLPRLGSFILASMMQKRGWDVEIIVEQTQNIPFQKIEEADYVGISTITPTAPRAYAIADRIRKMGIPVVMGGPHVTYLYREGLDHADYVIRGEGEHALMALVDVWEGKGTLSEVPNLAYNVDGKIQVNPIQPFIENLDDIPFPDFSLLKTKLLHIGRRKTIPVQTSRGCPFNCSFCSVTGMFGKKYRFRSTENIIRELRQYNHPKNDIFFYDDNFTANRDRTKKLLRRMIEEGFKFRWSTQVRVDIAKDLELIRLMKKAGCHTLYIGFESINPESLKEMHKAQTIDDMMQAIKTLHKYRINIHGMFVYGFDEDNWKTVKKTVKFAKKAKLSSTQFLILTPLPGSDLYNQMNIENRIQFQDWNLYDAHHVVFRPKRFSFLDLQKAQIFSHKKFYSIKESFKKIWSLKWLDIAIAHYARQLNRSWKKQNKTYLRVIELLTPSQKANISIQYKEKVNL